MASSRLDVRSGERSYVEQSARVPIVLIRISDIVLLVWVCEKGQLFRCYRLRLVHNVPANTSSAARNSVWAWVSSHCVCHSTHFVQDAADIDCNRLSCGVVGLPIKERIRRWCIIKLKQNTYCCIMGTAQESIVKIIFRKYLHFKRILSSV